MVVVVLLYSGDDDDDDDDDERAMIRGVWWINRLTFTVSRWMSVRGMGDGGWGWGMEGRKEKGTDEEE